MPKTAPTEIVLTSITGLSSALKFSRKSLLVAAASIALASPMLIAQNVAAPAAASSPTPTASATAAPAFDVATIKPFRPGPQTFMGIVDTPNGVHASDANLAMLVVYAYGLRTEDQVTGPDWAKTERYEVVAKMSAADIAEIQKMSNAEGTARRALMLQALLAERFQLKAHSETKMVPVYELVVAKGASKLKEAATDPNPPLGRGEDGKPHQGTKFLKDTSVWQAWSMENLAGFLSQPVVGVGRPVLDKTGLTTTYDFPINWSVYSAGAGAPLGSPEDNTASIFGALKEVGLQLHPATGPIDIIVIDHVEKPTAD
jgi:uncharacterized protein (TIGR03435 family)